MANEDGMPSNEVLKATAYGGVSEKAQCQEPQYSATGDKLQQISTIDQFTYQTDEGKFDRVAAESLLITAELDALMAEEADGITAEKRVWFRDTLHARLAALGNSSTEAARRKGACGDLGIFLESLTTCFLARGCGAVHLSVFNAFYKRCSIAAATVLQAVPRDHTACMHM